MIYFYINIWESIGWYIILQVPALLLGGSDYVVWIAYVPQSIILTRSLQDYPQVSAWVSVDCAFASVKLWINTYQKFKLCLFEGGIPIMETNKNMCLYSLSSWFFFWVNILYSTHIQWIGLCYYTQNSRCSRYNSYRQDELTYP